MKKATTLIICLLFLFGLTIFTSCTKNSNENLIDLKGTWVNENKDTLKVLDSGLIIYANYEPYYTQLYDYGLKGDSVMLFLAHSSNLQSRKGYFYKYANERIELYKFNNREKATFQRVGNE